MHFSHFFFLLILIISFKANSTLKYSSARSNALGETSLLFARGSEGLLSNPASLVYNSKPNWNYLTLQKYHSKTFGSDFSEIFKVQTTPSDDNLNSHYGDIYSSGIDLQTGYTQSRWGIVFNSSTNVQQQYINPVYTTFLLNLIKDDSITFGYSKIINKKLFMGISFSAIQRTAADQNFNMSSVGDKSPSTLISESLSHKGYGFGLNYGLFYTLNDFLINQVALSWSDIGTTHFKKTSGLGVRSQRDNLSLGASNIFSINQFKFLNAFEIHDSKNKSEFIRQLKLGSDINYNNLSFRIGLSDGYPSYGFGYKYNLFKIDFTKYTVEMGSKVGQLGDNRTQLQISFRD